MPLDLPNKLKRAAGCVVYHRDAGGALWLLLIHDRYNTWTLPKGHLKPGEDDTAAAVREVWEETGVWGELGPLVATIEYGVLSKQGRPRQKQVAFFLLRASTAEATPRAEEGITAAEWLAPAEALARASHPQLRDVLRQALALLV